MKFWKIKILFFFIFFLLSLQISFGQKEEAILVESAGYTNSEIASLHIDMLRNEINKAPDNIGYIIIYGGKVNKVGEIEAHLRGISLAFKLKGVDKSKIKIIQGGFREKLTLDYWAVSPNSCPPLPTPTIEIENVKFRGVSQKIIYHECC